MNDAAASIVNNIVRVSDHAMLVRLNVQQWTARKTDRRLADETAERTGGAKSMHSHSRRIIAKEALDKIDKIARDARAYHRRNTRPWQYEGVGILHSKFYLDYLKQMRTYEDQFNAAVAVFVPAYPTLMVEAQQLLGDTYNKADYPHPLDIEHRFAFQLHFNKVEMGSDFRLPDIGQEAEAQIRRAIDDRANEAVQGIIKSVWEEIFEQVNHMVVRLHAFNEREATPKKERGSGRKGTFTESMVDNLRELVERLPRINITQDPRIDDMRMRLLKQLCATDADDLRTMPLTRKDVITQAEKILAEVGEFLA